MGTVGGGGLESIDIRRLYIYVNSKFLIGTQVFYSGRSGYIANANESSVWVRFRDTNRMTRFSWEFLESFKDGNEKPKVAKKKPASRVKHPAVPKRVKARKSARCRKAGQEDPEPSRPRDRSSCA